MRILGKDEKASEAHSIDYLRHSAYCQFQFTTSRPTELEGDFGNVLERSLSFGTLTDSRTSFKESANPSRFLAGCGESFLLVRLGISLFGFPDCFLRTLVVLGPYSPYNSNL